MPALYRDQKGALVPVAGATARVSAVRKKEAFAKAGVNKCSALRCELSLLHLILRAE